MMQRSGGSGPDQFVNSGPIPTPHSTTVNAMIATNTTSPTASTELQNMKPSSGCTPMNTGKPTYSRYTV